MIIAIKITFSAKSENRDAICETDLFDNDFLSSHDVYAVLGAAQALAPQVVDGGRRRGGLAAGGRHVLDGIAVISCCSHIGDDADSQESVKVSSGVGRTEHALAHAEGRAAIAIAAVLVVGSAVERGVEPYCKRILAGGQQAAHVNAVDGEGYSTRARFVVRHLSHAASIGVELVGRALAREGYGQAAQHLVVALVAVALVIAHHGRVVGVGVVVEGKSVSRYNRLGPRRPGHRGSHMRAMGFAWAPGGKETLNDSPPAFMSFLAEP